MELTKRILTLFTMLLICATAAFAQSSDYTRWEFFGGYSALQFDTLGGDTGSSRVDDILSGRNTLRGFELAVTRNFHKYVGATFDYSLQLRADNFSRPARSGTGG